ncbi:MAG: GAF domain-containing protein [Anaerolineae bacterium]|jgi:GAF domain-containing protein|nr:GAF domain-containing protein [Anaerolineae bacterium]
MDTATAATVLSEIQAILASQLEREAQLMAVCRILAERVPTYDWVGFYLVDPDHARELVLGPFVGAPTEHTHIKFGQGICGQAAEREQTFVIQDVSAETNYLSCSAHVKSEIVIPVFRDGGVVGELDIDSHTLAPFSATDRQILEQIAALVAPLL